MFKGDTRSLDFCSYVVRMIALPKHHSEVPMVGELIMVGLGF